LPDLHLPNHTQYRLTLQICINVPFRVKQNETKERQQKKQTKKDEHFFFTEKN